MHYVLDTHILLWWVGGSDRLSAEQGAALDAAHEDQPLLVSDITLWEIATLHSLGRIRLGLPLRDWLEAATAAPLVRRIGISPPIAAQVADLPDSFHRDPADRVLVATARAWDATLITSDRRIVESGLVPTL